MSSIPPSSAVAILDDHIERLGLMRPGSVGRPHALKVTTETRAILSAIVELTQQVPQNLVASTPIRYGHMQVAIEDIRTAIELASHYASGSTAIKPLSAIDKDSAKEWRRFSPEVIRDVLLDCSDDPIQKSDHRLLFITPPELREPLLLDITAVNQALATNAHKAATVIGGSVLEALLLWAILRLTPLQQQASIATLSKKPHSDPHRWDLFELAEVAKSAGIVSVDTSSMISMARGFRNLIHPGLAVRKNQRCNLATAFTVKAAIERVIDELQTSAASP